MMYGVFHYHALFLLFLCFLQHAASVIKQASRASEMMVIHRHLLLLLLLLMVTTVLLFFEMQNDVRWERVGVIVSSWGMFVCAQMTLVVQTRRTALFSEIMHFLVAW
jgi:hypothetical protein